MHMTKCVRVPVPVPSRSCSRRLRLAAAAERRGARRSRPSRCRGGGRGASDAAKAGGQRPRTSAWPMRSRRARPRRRVDLKYDISARPAAGQPFEVELTFLPRAAATRSRSRRRVPGLTSPAAPAKFDRRRGGRALHGEGAGAVRRPPGCITSACPAKLMNKVQTDVAQFLGAGRRGHSRRPPRSRRRRRTRPGAVESMPAAEPRK